MSNLKDFKNSFFDLIRLSLPILAGNLSHILIGIVDTIVAGKYSTVALGAVSVASAIIMTLTIGAFGIVLSVSPVVSNNIGANIKSKKFFKLTILFSVLISIPFFLIAQIFISKINYINLSPDLVEPCRIYLNICVWTIFPAIIFVSVKEFLQAYEKVIFTNILMLIMVILNAVLNIIFTFGFNYSFIRIPEMGVEGLALATLISRIIPTAVILLYCLPILIVHSKRTKEESKKYIKDLVKTGVPISAAMFFEFLGFNLTAVLIGKFSALYAGVHNIMLCIANFTFMIVLSFSNAASIKIGYFNGKNDIKSMIKYAKTCYFAIFIICLTAFLFILTFKNQIISMFSNDAEVLFWCKKVIKIVLCFLFFDGMQCASSGILKGLKDTKTIAATTLAGYIFIAIPFGLYMAYHKNLVLEGFWSGLALALFTIAIIVTSRVLYDFRKIKN